MRERDESWLWLKVGLVYLVPFALAWMKRPARFALAAGPILLATLVFSFQLDVILEHRTFFGVHRVVPPVPRIDARIASKLLRRPSDPCGPASDGGVPGHR